MLPKKNAVILILAFALGVMIYSLPRPEGTQFHITGDTEEQLLQSVSNDFKVIRDEKKEAKGYILEVLNPDLAQPAGIFLADQIDRLELSGVEMAYVNGLSPKALRFLAILAVLVLFFILEPVPLEITAICIGVFLVAFEIGSVKDVWAPYMHPVVVFIICCLILAIALDKAGLTKRLGYFIVKKAGSSITRFTFIISIGLGISSGIMHDAAACAIGIATMLPLMRAVGIQPNTNTARFMMISLAFACSCGGMGTLVGGGRNMVSAAFLKEFTGIEITFMDWLIYAMPAALITVPAAVCIVYLVYRPDPKFKLPQFDEDLGPWTPLEIKTLIIILIVFGFWLTKNFHGIDYSVPGMLGVAALIMTGVLKWDDIHENLEWGTAIFIFGGGISLGLAMDYSGAARYFANLFFPLIKGGGWLLLFAGVGVFAALVTNAMANVAAAALILPIVIPMAQMEGVNPIVLAMCLGMATSFAMLLVIGCPPNAIAYSYRQFKAFDLTKVGLVATPILLLILVGVVMVWWRIIGLV
ncbi:MAG: DASS family sodium-coupled anion symporter [Desulfobacterales bacterium]